MLPNAIDPDSNFALEVNCVEGSFEGMYLCLKKMKMFIDKF